MWAYGSLGGRASLLLSLPLSSGDFRSALHLHTPSPAPNNQEFIAGARQSQSLRDLWGHKAIEECDGGLLAGLTPRLPVGSPTHRPVDWIREKTRN